MLDYRKDNSPLRAVWKTYGEWLPDAKQTSTPVGAGNALNDSQVLQKIQGSINSIWQCWLMLQRDGGEQVVVLHAPDSLLQPPLVEVADEYGGSIESFTSDWGGGEEYRAQLRGLIGQYKPTTTSNFCRGPKWAWNRVLLKLNGLSVTIIISESRHSLQSCD